MPNVPGVQIIQTQKLHHIIQDMDTGILALVPVTQVSSSQMGLNLLAPMQPSDPEGQSHVPSLIEGSHKFSGAYYHPHPCSWPHECPPQQLSPSLPLIHCCSPSPLPCPHPSSSCHSSPPAHQHNYSPSQHQPQQHPSHHNTRPTSGNVQEAEPMELDPLKTQGESSMEVIPWHPIAESLTAPANSLATLAPFQSSLSTNLLTNDLRVGLSNTPLDMR